MKSVLRPLVPSLLVLALCAGPARATTYKMMPDSALADQADDPRLYDDRRDRTAGPVAGEAADRVLAVRDAAMALADAITDVRELTVHLGHDEAARGGLR